MDQTQNPVNPGNQNIRRNNNFGRASRGSNAPRPIRANRPQINNGTKPVPQPVRQPNQQTNRPDRFSEINRSAKPQKMPSSAFDRTIEMILGRENRARQVNNPENNRVFFGQKALEPIGNFKLQRLKPATISANFPDGPNNGIIAARAHNSNHQYRFRGLST